MCSDRLLSCPLHLQTHLEGQQRIAHNQGARYHIYILKCDDGDDENSLTNQQVLEREEQLGWKPALALEARSSPLHACKYKPNALSAGAGMRAAKAGMRGSSEVRASRHTHLDRGNLGASGREKKALPESARRLRCRTWHPKRAG